MVFHGVSGSLWPFADCPLVAASDPFPPLGEWRQSTIPAVVVNSFAPVK